MKAYKPPKEKEENLFLFFVVVLVLLVGFGVWYAKKADQMTQEQNKKINCDYAFGIKDIDYLNKFCLGEQD
jgi:cytochrome c-type biogenesis protein CcmH/NrfF